jgi:polysaccharide chain length determinant protein (PEP-CTERM system associated)
VIPGRVFSVGYILGAVKRRAAWIAVPFAAALLLAVAFAYSIENAYRSETVILLVPQRVPTDYIRPTITQPIESRLRSIAEQVRSRSRLELLITELNLYGRERQAMPIESVVAIMRNHIEVSLARTDSFTLAFTYRDAQLAAQVTDRLAWMFIQENLRDRESQAETTSSILETELEQARNRLITHEKKLEQYRRLHSGQLPTQAGSNLQQIQNTSQQIQALREGTNRLQDRRLDLQRQLSDAQAPQPVAAPPPVAQPAGANALAPVGQTAAQKSESATRELESLRARGRTPDHPDIVRLERQIRDLAPQVRAEAEAAKNRDVDAPSTTPVTAAEINAQSRIRNLRAELTGLEKQIAHNEAEEERLRGLIASYQGRLDALPTRESELAELTRDYATLQASYQGLLVKREDSQLATNLEKRQAGEQFKVIDGARVMEEPVSPNRPMLIGGGIVAGLALGLLLAAFFEFRDSTFRTEDEIVLGLTLPVLALIPEIMTTVETVRRRRRNLLMSATVAVLAMGVGAAIWVMRSRLG